MRMNSHKFTSFMAVLMLSLLFLKLTQQQQPRYLNHKCSDTNAFARGSKYHYNLESLLNRSSTLDEATYANGYFSNMWGRRPHAAYSHFLCLPSLTVDNCRGLAQSPLSAARDRGKKTIKVVIITLSSVAAVLAILVAGWYLSTRGQRRDRDIHLQNTRALNRKHFPNGAIIETDEDDAGQEMHYLSFAAIYAATDGFSNANKLGEGGFGPVYKGVLPYGKAIAIKRLSKKSSQGLTEFKNEVLLIIKLQHRNLVRLLGYCVDRDEKLLVYEYMANNSLDSFLFDSTRNKELDWGTRMKIIHGTARGLQYLHEDSRLKIIHRNLKASNVQIRYSSWKISPSEVRPSAQTADDVPRKSSPSLPILAWQSWRATEGLNMVDEIVADSCTPSEAIRCIHVALLCVQDQVTDRPTISNIVSMLKNDRELPQPKEPKFTFQTTWRKSSDQSVPKSEYSKYELTQSTFEGR